MKPSEVELLKKGDKLYRVNAQGKVVTGTFQSAQSHGELLNYIDDEMPNVKSMCSLPYFYRSKAEALHVYLRQCKDGIPAHEASIEVLKQTIAHLQSEVERVEKILGM